MTAAMGKGGQELALHGNRQGGREQNRAAAGAGMKLQQHAQHAQHVVVAGVDFVHQQHLMAQAQQAQRLMAALQHREQRLIQGSHAGGREQGSFGVIGEPGGAACAGSFILLSSVVLRGGGG